MFNFALTQTTCNDTQPRQLRDPNSTLLHS
jgi:hypothetical protein